MAENVSNGKSNEQKIMQNEFALMRSIIAQCDDKTLISKGNISRRNKVMVHYQLPSGLHVYCEKPLNLQSMYGKQIDANQDGTYIYVTSDEVAGLETKKLSEGQEYYYSGRESMRKEGLPFIEYYEQQGPRCNYECERRYFDNTESRIRQSSIIRVETALRDSGETDIAGTVLLEGINGLKIGQGELAEYEQGSEYFSDIFQKMVDENKKYNVVEMLAVSHQVRPLFKMLEIEKQRLRSKGNIMPSITEITAGDEEARMAEMKMAVEGIQKLGLTQDEIGYLESVLKELRENNTKKDQGGHAGQERPEEK